MPFFEISNKIKENHDFIFFEFRDSLNPQEEKEKKEIFSSIMVLRSDV